MRSRKLTEDLNNSFKFEGIQVNKYNTDETPIDWNECELLFL